MILVIYIYVTHYCHLTASRSERQCSVLLLCYTESVGIFTLLHLI